MLYYYIKIYGYFLSVRGFMTDFSPIQDFISQFPIYQYAFIKPEAIDFDQSLRAMCKRDCPKYDTSWGCPPAVVKADKCRSRCMKFSDALVFSTFAAADGRDDVKSRLSSLDDHEKLTGIIESHMKDIGLLTYTISSDACHVCSKCTFPFEECRKPDEMHACIESHGIMIRKLAEDCLMDYDLGEKLYLWFTIIFFRDVPVPELSAGGER